MKFKISYYAPNGVDEAFDRKITNLLKKEGYEQYASGYDTITARRDLAFEIKRKAL